MGSIGVDHHLSGGVPKGQACTNSRRGFTHFNPYLPIQLSCDASPYGVGAVISHILLNGEDKPIAFPSRALNKAEKNCAQLEREALSIDFAT